MTCEEFLLKSIQACVHGLEMNIQCLQDCPEDGLPGFNDGKIVGFTYAIRAIQATLRLYDRKVKDKIPGELTEPK